ncbi:hypothetical protein FACS1894216_02480 [Synergistales bacterium]|nr:hypothetical protein FACS1894216_02480 [Synergistales bacterium]
MIFLDDILEETINTPESRAAYETERAALLREIGEYEQEKRAKTTRQPEQAAIRA